MPDTRATLEAVSDEALARRIAGGPQGSTDTEEAELLPALRTARAAVRPPSPAQRRGRRRSRAGRPAADDRTAARGRGAPARRNRVLHPGYEPDDGSGRTPGRPAEGSTGSAIHGYARGDGTVVRCHTRRTAHGGVLARTRRAGPAVVVLTFYAHHEAPRIAKDLGVSPGAVRVIRHRAMARLRDCVLGGARR